MVHFNIHLSILLYSLFYLLLEKTPPSEDNTSDEIPPEY